MHKILIELDAFGVSLFRTLPFLAILKLVLVGGVGRKSQLFGGIGEQRHGIFHLYGGVPHERTRGEGTRRLCGGAPGHLAHVGDGKIYGHASPCPAPPGNESAPVPGGCGNT